MKINTGKTLSYLRKSHNLTQQQIADLINVSRPTYTNWEKDSGEISLTKILILLKYFQIGFLDFIHMLELENNIDLKTTTNINKIAYVSSKMEQMISAQ